MRASAFLVALFGAALWFSAVAANAENLEHGRSLRGAFGGVVSSVNCPYASAYPLDGCVTNPMLGKGNFQNKAFFNTGTATGWNVAMLQSGQSSLTVTPPFDAAGVTGGYSIGIPSTIFTGSISGTTLTVTSVQSGTIAVGQTLDELHGVLQGTHIVSGSGLSWTVDKSQTVSSQQLYAQPLVSPDSPGLTGCTYYQIGASGNLTTTVAELRCAGTIALNYVDFSASNKCYNSAGTGCVDGKATILYIHSGTAVAATINYPKMVMDLPMNQATGALPGGTAFVGKVVVNIANPSITLTGGIYDACASVDPYCSQGFNNYLNTSGTYSGFLFDSSNTGQWLIQYGVWVNVDGRFIGRAHADATGDSVELDYNYICGMAYGTNAPHGEFDLLGADASTTVSYYKAQYNTFCQPANVVNNQDGVAVTANIYSGKNFIDGITAGALSSQGSAGTGQKITDGGTSIPAATTQTGWGTGVTGTSCTAGATPATATCVLMSANGTSNGTRTVALYAGSATGNATTSILAPWGAIGQSLTELDVINNTAIINQSPIYGISNTNCVSLGVYPCFPTAATALVELQYDTYGSVTNVSGNYVVPTGSYFVYSTPFYTDASASINGTTLTSTLNTLPIGYWVTDSSTQPGTLNGNPAPTITSAPSGSGPYTYTLSSTGATRGSGNIYVRAANWTVTTNNKIMSDNSVCNPAATTKTDIGCTGVW